MIKVSALGYQFLVGFETNLNKRPYLVHSQPACQIETGIYTAAVV